MKNHPNATLAGSTIGPGVVIVWLLGHFGVDVSAEVGTVIGGAAAAGLLFIGRNGIRGAWQRLWRGSSSTPANGG